MKNRKILKILSQLHFDSQALQNLCAKFYNEPEEQENKLEEVLSELLEVSEDIGVEAKELKLELANNQIENH